MKGLQQKLIKLILAHKQKGLIVIVDQEQNYSLKFKNTFTKFTVKITTEKKIKLRKKYYALWKETKDKTYKIKADEYLPEKYEFKNRLAVVLFLVENYKGLVDDE